MVTAGETPAPQGPLFRQVGAQDHYAPGWHCHVACDWLPGPEAGTALRRLLNTSACSQAAAGPKDEATGLRDRRDTCDTEPDSVELDRQDGDAAEVCSSAEPPVSDPPRKPRDELAN